MSGHHEASLADASHTSDDQKITSAGKIHMLDLASLKARLGDKWERMSEHVRLFFEAAIKRGLGPGDTYVCLDELSYLVMFRDLSAEQAEFHCAAIAEEVCKRLFGENGARVALRNLVSQVDLSALPTGTNRNAALDLLLERHGKEAIVTAEPNKSARHAVEEIGGRNFSLGFTNESGMHRIASRDIAFLYRPLWDTAKQVVLTYICQPTFSQFHTDIAKPNFGFCVAEEESDQAALDTLAFQECVTRATRLTSAGLRVLLAIPVHFETIARPKFWMGYHAVYRQIPQDILRDLGFIVFGIDQGVPNIRLAQEIPKVSRGTHHVICMADHCDNAGAQFSKTGTYALGMTVNAREPEKQAFERMNTLTKQAREAGTESFVLGVNTTSLVLHGINSGIRYIEGPVVRPAVSDPRHAYIHSVEDLYQASLAKMPRHTAEES
ncbi:MAG TPA: hypothetical protein VK779_13060 [Rhizomicrobium sp.]|jgi:hypothetical protein|nr:hypothetical protein [Rhizomicrobium sp.]